MTAEDAAKYPAGDKFLNMYLNSDNDREASDDQKLPAVEDDVLQEDGMLESYPLGTPLIRLTPEHCRGKCYLKLSDGTRTVCVCGRLAIDCDNHTKSEKSPSGYYPKAPLKHPRSGPAGVVGGEPARYRITANESKVSYEYDPSNGDDESEESEVTTVVIPTSKSSARVPSKGTRRSSRPPKEIARRGRRSTQLTV